MIKGKKGKCVAKVMKRISPSNAYSWELSSVKVIEARIVDTDALKSNDVVLCNSDGSSVQLAVFDYNIIDVSGLDVKAVHGYLVILAITKENERLTMTVEVCFIRLLFCLFALVQG